MRKWWRKFKNKHGWDFKKGYIGLFFCRTTKYKKYPDGEGGWWSSRETSTITDPNGCYYYKCSYCGLTLRFPWRETPLAYHNIQRHIKAKHIDVL